MMHTVKLVCFDLDDTLIREVHSVMYLAVVNNKLDELMEIERSEARGDFSWIEADYYKAKLAKGLNLDIARSEFLNIVKPISNIRNVIKKLHDNNIK
jgi:phosphoserine phosphatase